MACRDLLDYIKAKGLHKLDQTLSTPALTPPTQAAPPQPTLTAKPASQGEPYIDIPLTNMRKVIAKRLTQSKVSGGAHSPGERGGAHSPR